MKNNVGFTIWLTGLPSSGKSTIARLLAQRLRQRKISTEILDGDVIRKNLWNELGYTKKDRLLNLKRVIFIAKLLTRNNVVVITAFVSPYKSIRQYARRQIRNFIEVYVKCPLEICMRRDVKGLYKKALSGEIKNFTGISHPYEEPKHPELILESDVLTPTKSVEEILKFLNNI